MNGNRRKIEYDGGNAAKKAEGRGQIKRKVCEKPRAMFPRQKRLVYRNRY